MKLIRSIFFLVVSLAVVSACVVADPSPVSSESQVFESEQADFFLEEIVTDLAHPWGFAFLPDESILITERPGRLWLYDGSGLTEIDNLPDIDPHQQGGLLDVLVHPNYAQNGWIYMTYSSRYDGGFGTAVSRARLRGSSLVDLEQVFRMNNPTGSGAHFGSRLVFDGNRNLYFTIGDRGQRNRAQDSFDHAGSVIRLRANGSIPASNPFMDGGGAPEIFSYGHRNAQGIALHPETGAVWLHEHGPQGGDEINVLGSGNNYGWPRITYGVNYGVGTEIGEGTEAPGLEQPITYWSPSIAPSGMAFYTGDIFPEWQGDLFVGALAGQHLRRVELDGQRVVSEEVLLPGVVGRIRDVRQGPDGSLYILTDEDRGSLYRLSPR